MDLRQSDNAGHEIERDYRETAADWDQVKDLGGVGVTDDLLSRVVAFVRSS